MKNSRCALWRNPANLTEKQQIVALVCAGILGLAAIFAGIGWIRMRMMREWVQTTGQITTKSGGLSEGLPAIYPTFRWQDEAGNEYRRTSNVRASLGPRAGQLIPVRSEESAARDLRHLRPEREDLRADRRIHRRYGRFGMSLRLVDGCRTRAVIRPQLVGVTR